MTNPDLLAQPEHGFSASACIFATIKGLNDDADRDDVLTIRKRINGGTHGLAERKQLLKRAKQILGA